MYIMLKDRPVIYFNEHSAKLLGEQKLVPHFLQDAVNRDNVISWISHRAVPLNKVNAKKILEYQNLSKDQSYQIALACRGLSLVDSYWVREDNDNSGWSDINLYKNSFSKAVAYLAFPGSNSISIQSDIGSPALIAQGGYEKCWRREADGIYLYKANTSRGTEAENEYVCSLIAEVLSIDHVKYSLCEYNGKKTSKCKLITDEDKSILSMQDYYIYCQRHKLNMISEVEKKYPKQLWQMVLFDGIVNNTDRSDSNWGWYLQADSGELLGLHPLLDHNCAITLNHERNSQIYESMTTIEAAIHAYNNLGKPQEVVKLYKWLNKFTTKCSFKKIYNDTLQLEFIKNRVEQIMR